MTRFQQIFFIEEILSFACLYFVNIHYREFSCEIRASYQTAAYHNLSEYPFFIRQTFFKVWNIPISPSILPDLLMMVPRERAPPLWELLCPIAMYIFVFMPWTQQEFCFYAIIIANLFWWSSSFYLTRACCSSSILSDRTISSVYRNRF